MQEVIGSIPFRSIVLNKYPLAKAGGYLFSSAFFLFFIFLRLRIVPPCGRGSLLYLVLKKIKNRSVYFYTPKKSLQNFCFGFWTIFNFLEISDTRDCHPLAVYLISKIVFLKEKLIKTSLKILAKVLIVYIY